MNQRQNLIICEWNEGGMRQPSGYIVNNICFLIVFLLKMSNYLFGIYHILLNCITFYSEMKYFTVEVRKIWEFLKVVFTLMKFKYQGNESIHTHVCLRREEIWIIGTCQGPRMNHKSSTSKCFFIFCNIRLQDKQNSQYQNLSTKLNVQYICM